MGTREVFKGVLYFSFRERRYLLFTITPVVSCRSLILNYSPDLEVLRSLLWMGNISDILKNISIPRDI